MPNDMSVATPPQAANLLIEQLLVLSTAHVPQAAIDLLAEVPQAYPLRVLSDEFGVLLSLPDEARWQETTDALMAGSRPLGRMGCCALVRAMALAVDAGASHLSFDRDGPVLPELAVFEW